jgi:hypothetical protein
MDTRPNARNLFSPGEVQRCLLCNGEYQPAVEPHVCEIESDWTGCYRDSWKGLIVPDAFSHPAKFSRSLIHRIYQHAKEEKWLEPGSTVIDPFGGVALGGLEAAWHGAHWVGCELEQKFVDLGNQNIALWQARFGHMSTWGSVRLMQGDSRQLSSVLERAGLCVSSPPFGESSKGGGISAAMRGESDYKVDRMPGSVYQPSEQGTTDGNLCNLPAKDEGLRLAISSPPYNDARQGWATTNERSENIRYGNTEGQMSDMPATGAALTLAISSPPFADSVQAHDPKYQSAGDDHGPRHSDYGTSPGQLGAMKEHGGAEMVVSSPPYEGCPVDSYGKNPGGGVAGKNSASVHHEEWKTGEGYGRSAGQLGHTVGDDFWSAAREIVAQTYIVLAPNSHAIWVLKGFIRKKTYVDFPDQWRQLCESLGFRTLHWHRAWLVEPGETQVNLLGEKDVDYTKERKSFFRRLAEKKGSPRIDFEVVLCMLRP